MTENNGKDVVSDELQYIIIAIPRELEERIGKKIVSSKNDKDRKLLDEKFND